MIDSLIAYHCAPALAGIKPANIFSCRKSEYPELHRELRDLNMSFNKKDIYFEILCECEKRALVMIYRRNRLSEQLEISEIRRLLSDHGYPRAAGLDDMLGVLRTRIAESPEFPHEIGAFLGYPIEDIYGFIDHKNENCLYTGYWRVYGDVEKCKECFRRYDICRNAILKRLERGHSLAGIFCAA